MHGISSILPQPILMVESFPLCIKLYKALIQPIVEYSVPVWVFFAMFPKNEGGFSCVDTHVFGRREPPVQLSIV